MENEDKVKPCDCKGKRTCLLCENLLDIKPRNFYREFQVCYFLRIFEEFVAMLTNWILDQFQALDAYVFCTSCQKIYRGWDAFKSCNEHESEDGRDFPGVYVYDFLSSEESKQLVEGVDNLLGWDASQSGRRKKNFGPKVNFKKKKLSLGKFEGFPALTKFVRDRLKTVPILHDFEAVEECFLEYELARGSHIEPHIDDCWIWLVFRFQL